MPQKIHNCKSDMKNVHINSFLFEFQRRGIIILYTDLFDLTSLLHIHLAVMNLICSEIHQQGAEKFLAPPTKF